MLLLSGHSAAISCVAAAADGSLLVTTSVDGSARVWELEKGECLAVLLGHSAPVCTHSLTCCLLCPPHNAVAGCSDPGH